MKTAFTTPTLVSLLMFTACGPETPKPTTDTGTGATEDGVCDLDATVNAIVENEDGNCEIWYEHEGEECNHPVSGVIITGTGDDLGEITVTPPDACDVSNQAPSSHTFEEPSELPEGEDEERDWDWIYAVSQYEGCLPEMLDGNGDPQPVGTPDQSISCPNDLMGEPYWTVELGPPDAGQDCETTYPDYEDYELSFILSGDGCERSAIMRVPNSGCVAATGVPLDFTYETVFDKDKGTTQYATLTPVQQSGVPYTERAWLRKIHVTDWGDVTNLHALGWGGRLTASESDAIDDTDQFQLAPGTNTLNLSVGDAVMGTIWSVDGLPSNDPTFELPSIEVDWSCQVNTNDPHYTVVSPPQGYEIKLSETGISGVDASQRLIIRFPNTSMMYLYVEGRSEARLDFPLAPATGGGYSFDRTLHTHGGVHLAGTITVNGSDRDVTFTDFEINGNDFGTPTWTFEAL